MHNIHHYITFIYYTKSSLLEGSIIRREREPYIFTYTSAPSTLPCQYFFGVFLFESIQVLFSLIFTRFGIRTSDSRGTPWDIFQKDLLNQLSWRKSVTSYLLLCFLHKVSGFEPAPLGSSLETSSKDRLNQLSWRESTNSYLLSLLY